MTKINGLTLILISFTYPLLQSCQQADQEASTPNIIYILADDLGIGDLSTYNPNGKIPTPNLDRLASEGMRFTDAHTSSAVCTPTRYGILTGRYNWRSRLKQGVLTGKSKALIPKDRTTVASLLKSRGYQTGFVGKWHLGWNWGLKDSVEFGGTGWNAPDFENLDFTKPITHTPNDLGFDYAYGHSGSLDMAPYVYVENGRPTSIPTSSTVSKTQYGWWREGPTSDDFIHEEVTPHFFDKATQFMRRAADSEEPFFLYLALPSPHTPILPPEEWIGKSGLSLYADFMMQIDDHVGQLLSALEETGQANNTLVIFTSDNGCSPAAGIKEMKEQDHFPSLVYRGHKADIFEGGHRVPFIVRWPARMGRGAINDQLICTTDLMATVAEINGYSLADNEGEDSYSMLPAFLGQSSKRPAAVHHSINGSFAIRKDDWKLIMAPGSAGWSFPRPNRDSVELAGLPPIQLYNLADDPGETQNLQAANTEKVEDLKLLLAQYITEGRSTPGTPQSNDPIEGEWRQVGWMSEL